MAKLPTPTRKVMAKGPAPISQPRGQMAAAQVFGQVAQQADKLSNTFFDIAAKDAERRADKEVDSYVFAKDPVTGQIVPPELPNIAGQAIPSIYDQRYTEGIKNRYQEQALDKVSVDINGIADRNKDNPTGFREDIEAYREGFLGQVPEDQAGLFDTSLSRMVVPYTNRIDNNRAKIDHLVNQDVAYRGLDKEVDTMQQLIANGVSPEQEMQLIDRLSRALVSHRETGTLNDLEIQAYEHVIEAHAVYSDIARSIAGPGNNPGSDQGQAKIAATIQGVMDGTLEVSVAGRKSPIGKRLNEEERTVVARQLNRLSAHHATMEQLRDSIEQDFLITNYIMPGMAAAMVTGEEPDMAMMGDALRQVRDPKVALYMMGQIKSMEGTAHSRQGEFVLDYGANDALTFLQQRMIDNPDLEDKLNAISPDPVRDQMEMAKVLAASGRTRQSNAIIKGILQREQSLSEVKVSAAQQDFMAAFQRQNHEKQSKKGDCRRHSGSRLTQCLASAESIPLDDQAGKGALEIGAQMIDSQVSPDGPIDWRSEDPTEVGKQSQAVSSYGRNGTFSPGFLSYLTQVIGDDDQSSPQRQRAIDFFESADQASSVAAARLSSDSTGLGPNVYRAYSFISRMGGSMANSETVAKMVPRLLAGERIDDLFPPTDQKLISSAFTNRESDAAEAMSDEVFNHIYGKTDRGILTDVLPADETMQADMQWWARMNADWPEDKDIIPDLAFKAMTDSGKYVLTTRAASRGRAGIMTQQGAWDSLGRGNPAKQYVPRLDAPEYWYPDVDPNNPGLTMMLFDRAVEQVARSIDPSKDWISGVNVSVRRMGETTEGGQTFRLSFVDANGNDIFMDDDRAWFNFGETYNQIKDGTLANMETYRDVLNKMNKVKNRMRPEGSALALPLPADSQEMATLRRQLRDLRKGVIPEDLRTEEDTKKAPIPALIDALGRRFEGGGGRGRQK